MAMDKEIYQGFITRVCPLLVSNNWTLSTDVPEPFTHLFTRTDRKTIVFTRQALVFLYDTGFSQQHIANLVEKVHTWETLRGQPPLFPAITIIVFIQNQPRHVDWIQKHGKKRSLLKSHFTLPWVVSLQDKTLCRHTGLPLVKTGEHEIQEALHTI